MWYDARKMFVLSWVEEFREGKKDFMWRREKEEGGGRREEAALVQRDGWI